MIDVTCEVCGVVFQVRESRFWRKGRPVQVRYHDLNCRAIADKRDEVRECEVCGVLFHVSKGTKFKGVPQRYHSRACAAKARPRKTFLPARVTAQGYVEVYLPGHPRAFNGRVLEHIVVAESVLGRPLRESEQVHHRDGNKQNNEPENLLVLTAAQHGKLHYKDRSADETPKTEPWRKNFAKLSS